MTPLSHAPLPSNTRHRGLIICKVHTIVGHEVYMAPSTLLQGKTKLSSPIKWPGCQADPSSQSSTEGKNEWSFTSITLYVFRSCTKTILPYLYVSKNFKYLACKISYENEKKVFNKPSKICSNTRNFKQYFRPFLVKKPSFQFFFIYLYLRYLQSASRKL